MFLCLNALSLAGFLLHHVFFALVLPIDSPLKKRHELFFFSCKKNCLIFSRKLMIDLVLVKRFIVVTTKETCL